MVELVGHALVNSPVHLDVDIVPDLEGTQVDSQGDVTFVPEGPGEQVPSARTKPMTSRHRENVSAHTGREEEKKGFLA